uniref:Uncharacterized protein n=1 Tax=Hemiselmis andersenii TaxID=464988 RepID=A0A6U4Q2M7_HEMAN|mmetsp:Transcript_21927/g.50917  ORF Transcript_21927/g.50917 Transcript_21927/m.50917 type:complete len:123 (-) Transcript_21927:406-774(-)
MSSWISWARGEKGGEDASSSENTKSGGWLELGSSSPMRMASKKGGSFKDPAKEGDAESLKSPRPLAEGEDPVLQALFSFGEGLATPFLAFGSLVTEFSLSDEIEVWSEVVDKRLLHGKHDMK